MVKKLFLILFIFGTLFVSCISTYNIKGNLPYFRSRSSAEGFIDGWYLQSSVNKKTGNMRFISYYISRNNLVISYLIEDSTYFGFIQKLELEINTKGKEKIHQWGAYIIEKDTLRMQIISYHSKYNLFVRIPVIEHIFLINGNDLKYLYSTDIKGPNPKRFEVKDFHLEFMEFPLKPNLEELID